MTTTTERIAATAWKTATGHATEAGHWHCQLLEVIDGMVLGDTWQGDRWPGGDPLVLLGDWCCHTRASHLVLVSPNVATYNHGGQSSEHLVMVVGVDGGTAVLVGTEGREPFSMSVIGGELVTAMRRALQPADSQFLTGA